MVERQRASFEEAQAFLSAGGAVRSDSGSDSDSGGEGSGRGLLEVGQLFLPMHTDQSVCVDGKWMTLAERPTKSALMDYVLHTSPDYPRHLNVGACMLYLQWLTQVSSSPPPPCACASSAHTRTGVPHAHRRHTCPRLHT